MDIVSALPLMIVGVAALLFIFGGSIPGFRAPKELDAEHGSSVASLTDRLSNTSLKNSSWLGVSFVATQLTVTGGIVATTAGVHYYGYAMWAAPISFFIGIWVFWIVRKGAGIAKTNSIFDLAKKRQNTPVFMSYSIASVFIGMFLLGWELYVMGEIISAHYSAGNDSLSHLISNNPFIVIFSLALVAAIYVTKGGWDRVVKTDLIQLGGVGLFLGILFFSIDSETAKPFTSVFSTPIAASPLEVVLFLVPVLIINTTFATVTLNNWQVAHSAGPKTGKALLVGCLLLAAFYTIVTWVAINISSGNARDFFTSGTVVSAFLVGLAPVLTWSTVDTTAISVTHFIHRIVSANPTSAWSGYKTIYIVPALLLCGGGVAFLLNAYAPNILQSLLAGAGSLIIFAPWLIVALLHPGKQSFLANKNLAYFLFGVFVLTLGTGITLTLIGKGGLVALPASLGFFVSLIVCLYVLKKNNQSILTHA